METLIREDILELIENRNYTRLRAEIADANEADVAELIEELPLKQALEVFRLLPKDVAADVFAHLETQTQQELITSLSEVTAAQIIEDLQADDVADLLEEMPSNVVKRLLANASAETIDYVRALLQYPKESAGSLMTVEYVSLKEDWTFGYVLDHIRQSAMEDKMLNVCYVLTASRQLVGVVSLKDILLSDPNAQLKDVMETNPITVLTLDDQEEVANKFQKYDYSVLPVVDSQNHMVGIITVDDIMDVMEQEATEDMQKMAALIPTDTPYMQSSVLDQVKKRIPWLMFLMLSATFTGAIITSFEEKLAECIALTAYIPMLMDSGGNAGGQASTTIIRAISLNEVKFKDSLTVVWKESRIAICCGIILAAVNFIKMMVLSQTTLLVAVAVSITLIVTVFFAKFVGCFLPILAKSIKLDPAVMANPIITTIVDAISLSVYFGIATIMLGL